MGRRSPPSPPPPYLGYKRRNHRGKKNRQGKPNRMSPPPPALAHSQHPPLKASRTLGIEPVVQIPRSRTGNCKSMKHIYRVVF